MNLEVIKQFFKLLKEHNKIYKKYNYFFDLIYLSFHDQLLFNINRLHDKSRGALSILQLLTQNIEQYNDNSSIEEKKILGKIKNHDVFKKSKTLRDKLPKAHLDERIALNAKRRTLIYKENIINPEEYLDYIKLLEEARKMLYLRIDILCCDMVINDNTPEQIIKLFRNLS
jgi:hypothetical protein